MFIFNRATSNLGETLVSMFPEIDLETAKDILENTGGNLRAAVDMLLEDLESPISSTQTHPAQQDPSSATHPRPPPPPAAAITSINSIRPPPIVQMTDPEECIIELYDDDDDNNNTFNTERKQAIVIDDDDDDDVVITKVSGKGDKQSPSSTQQQHKEIVILDDDDDEDDDELREKIARVLSVIPGLDKDVITYVLNENGMDVKETINYFLDGSGAVATPSPSKAGDQGKNTQIKVNPQLKKLFEMFSTIDPGVIQVLLAENDGDIQKTINSLKESGAKPKKAAKKINKKKKNNNKQPQQKKQRTDMTRLSELFSNVNKEIIEKVYTLTNSSYEDTLCILHTMHSEEDEMEGTVTPKPPQEVHIPPWPELAVKTQLKEYIDIFRDETKAIRRKRREYTEKAAKAYEIGNEIRFFQLKDAATAINRELDERFVPVAKKCAQVYLVNTTSSDVKPVIDFHSFTVPETICVLEAVVTAYLGSDVCPNNLLVITGWGKHSTGNIPKLLPNVNAWLSRNKIPHVKYKGSFILNLNKKNKIKLGKN